MTKPYVKFNLPVPTKKEFQKRCEGETVLEDKTIKPHRHRWRHTSWSGRTVDFRCTFAVVNKQHIQRCKCRVSRLMTKAEQAWFDKHQGVKSWFRDAQTNVHRPWHDFVKKFQNPDHSEEVGEEVAG